MLGGLPELNCDCLICRELRKKEEKRARTSLLLSGKSTLLIDCGPDAKSQLLRNTVDNIDAVLISQEHGDHYMGLDELFAYKRSAPGNAFRPIPVFLTAESLEVIQSRFAYMEKWVSWNGVGSKRENGSGRENSAFFPLKQIMGSFAKGSVGFVIAFNSQHQRGVRLAYTSDSTNIVMDDKKMS